MAAITYTFDNITTPVLFESISIRTETRFTPDTDESQEEFRNVLRVVLLTRIDNVKTMSNVDAGVITLPSLTGSIKGGDTFTITPGTNFADFRLVSQEFVGIEQEGSKLVATRSEWVSISAGGSWAVLTWS